LDTVLSKAAGVNSAVAGGDKRRSRHSASGCKAKQRISALRRSQLTGSLHSRYGDFAVAQDEAEAQS
jgi:hypothetical protein